MSHNGYVYAWGDNTYGQLGIGTLNKTNTASRVWGVGAVDTLVGDKDDKKSQPDDGNYLTGIVKVAAGEGASLALASDGTVYAWGNAGNGRLGDTAYTNSTYASYTNANFANNSVNRTITNRYARKVPVQVVNGTAAGPDTHGDSYNYLSYIVDIDMTQQTAIALRSNGTAFTWGYSAQGQAGDGYTDNYVMAPTQVRGGEGQGRANSFLSSDDMFKSPAVRGSRYVSDEFFARAVDVSAGSSHIAILADDYQLTGTAGEGNRTYTIYSAGDNTYGQLGVAPDLYDNDGNLVSSGLNLSSTPVKTTSETTINTLTGATATLAADAGFERPVEVAAGKMHTMIRTADVHTDASGALDRKWNYDTAWRGYVWTLGYNEAGQLGNGERDGDPHFTPAKVVKGDYRRQASGSDIMYLEGIVDIDAGYYHSEAISFYYKNNTGVYDPASNTTPDNNPDHPDQVNDGMFGYVWNWGINTNGLTLADGSENKEVIGVLGDLSDYRQNTPVQMGARESMTIVVDYAEVRDITATTPKRSFGKKPAGVTGGPIHNNKMPPSITVTVDEVLYIERQNTHMAYTTGFALYPATKNLQTSIEAWATSIQDDQIGQVWLTGTGTAPTDALVIGAAPGNTGEHLGRTTVGFSTMNGHYNNNNHPGTGNSYTTADHEYGYKNGENGGANETWLVTGVYAGTVEIDLQESVNTILTGTAAGDNFTAFLDNNGTVWVWGDNQYGVMGQRNNVGTSGVSNENYVDRASGASAVANPQKVQTPVRTAVNDANGRTTTDPHWTTT